MSLGSMFFRIGCQPAAARVVVMSQPSAIATAMPTTCCVRVHCNRAAIHRRYPHGGHHEPDAALQRDALNSGVLHELDRHDVGRDAAGERQQRGEAHLEVELAFRPGAGRVDEPAGIEQAGGDGQESHHDEIAELSHLMSLMPDRRPEA